MTHPPPTPAPSSNQSRITPEQLAQFLRRAAISNNATATTSPATATTTPATATTTPATANTTPAPSSISPNQSTITNEQLKEFLRRVASSSSTPTTTPTAWQGQGQGQSQATGTPLPMPSSASAQPQAQQQLLPTSSSEPMVFVLRKRSSTTANLENTDGVSVSAAANNGAASNSDNPKPSVLFEPKRPKVDPNTPSGTGAQFGLTGATFSSSGANGSGNGGGSSPPGITISNEAMSSSPPVNELNEQVVKNGRYVVQNLTINHREHGSVTFLGYRNLKDIGPTIDLSAYVTFTHGGVRLTKANVAEDPFMTGGAKLFSLTNISREDFAKSFGITGGDPVSNLELIDMVERLNWKMGAPWGQYNEEKQNWVFLVL